MFSWRGWPFIEPFLAWSRIAGTNSLAMLNPTNEKTVPTLAINARKQQQQQQPQPQPQRQRQRQPQQQQLLLQLQQLQLN